MKTWINHFRTGDLSLDIEISSQCNSFCPQCMRYERGTENLSPWTKDTKWNLDKFKRMLDSESIRGIGCLNFSGTVGDPATCNDLPEMIKYAKEINPRIQIGLSTNGSLQNEDWWWKLGTHGGDNLSVAFAVEGTSQEVHSRYRRNTNLQKILENMRTLSCTNAHAGVFTVVFKHNQDQLEEIKEMTKEFGAKFWDQVESNRFREKTFEFIDRKGEHHILEQSEIKVENEVRLVKDYRIKEEIRDITEVVCKWNEWAKLLLLEDGSVFPCCFTSWPVQTRTKLFTGGLSFLNNPPNLKDNNLKEILSSDFFTKGLFESFDNPDYVCKRFCGK